MVHHIFYPFSDRVRICEKKEKYMVLEKSVPIFFAGLLICSTAVWAHDWMAPDEAAKQENPVVPSVQSIKTGRGVYKQFCAYCHGEAGKGLSSSTTGLSKDTPNLSRRLQNHSHGDFFWKIKNGRGEMPSFNEDLKAEEVWSTILYLDSLSKHTK